MTVIIKELIVKTVVVENTHSNSSRDINNMKNEIVRDCMQKLKKSLKKRKPER